jgi:hypothetical protein
MKWFSFFRALVYLKRISISINTIASIEESRYKMENPRYRSKHSKMPKEPISPVEITRPTAADFNARWREDNEIKAYLKDIAGEEEE